MNDIVQTETATDITSGGDRPQPSPTQVQVTQKEKELQARIALLASLEHFEGPLPPPKILLGYGELNPTFPDRILVTYEKENDHRHEMQKQTLQANIDSDIRSINTIRFGQLCGLVVVIVAFIIVGYAIYAKQPWVAGIIGTEGSATLVTAFKMHPERSNRRPDTNTPKKPNKKRR